MTWTIKVSYEDKDESPLSCAFVLSDEAVINAHLDVREAAFKEIILAMDAKIKEKNNAVF